MILAVHSLAQRTNQETSTPSKASPYMGRMQLTPTGDPLRQSFGMARKPVPLRGEPWFPTSPLSPPLGKGLRRHKNPYAHLV